ncbi:caspase domain-containing protein [Rhodoplanes sp. TEM]|uniref:Caspase domain-containing protein n=2 Tax=Nitrobacteraceae TaxID=41294 RepID=A0ABT5JKH0_RHOTP|nr:caspase domain-containing protein [Rhodoplanes tepidamans]MDC7789485.1 caspase domain-containing protein [Rhodoplanes tepidamans]MDC7986115.1 caspase domain-containing protein [Rhodoplanes sp. TEM]
MVVPHGADRVGAGLHAVRRERSMGDRICRWIAVLVGLAWVAGAAPAYAQERVALVIGNGAYRNATPLPNPPNDAADLARALRRIGFTVIEGRDLDKHGLEDKIRAFGRALDRATTALFFYAGHGLQVAGRNYLVPVDAKLERPGDLSFETVEVGQVLGQMEAGTRVNLVFLDACRDNPLARTLARSLGTRSGSVGTGLASIQSAVGTMIAYATQPDNVAYDGEGRNSPFTAALLKHLPTPGLDVAVLMRRIRSDVVAATQSRQVPWDHSSLIGDVVLVPAAAATPGPGPTPSASTPSAAVPSGAADAERAWAVTKDTTSIAVLEDFVRQFGGTPYASMARARLDELRRDTSRQSLSGLGALDVVRSFYQALGNADGATASRLVVGEKRLSGPFNAEAITRFYSSLAEPLRIESLSPIGSDQVLVEYRYSKNRRTMCRGSAIVTVINRNGSLLIEGIKALRGC